MQQFLEAVTIFASWIAFRYLIAPHNMGNQTIRQDMTATT